MSRHRLLLVHALLLSAGGLGAQTWDGGGANNNWNTKNNWNPNTNPSFNNSTDLTFTGSVRTTPDMNGNRTVNSVTFAAGAASFSLTGANGSNTETLTFNGTGGGIAQSSANDQSLLMNRIRITSSTATIQVNGAGDLLLGDGSATSGQLYGAGDLTKTGTGGALILSANNSNWSGDLAISAGVVQARANNALGDTAGVTTVASGAALQLGTGGLTLGETLTLNGTGIGGSGALRNTATSGTNTVTTAVALAGNTRINADAGGTLALTGGITGTNRSLTLGGAGNVRVSGAIATGTGSLTKDGAGTLRLAATNSFTGTTIISAGTIIAEASAVFSSTATLSVGAGALLDLNSTAQTIGNLSGAGTVGFGTGGSLTLASGNGTFSGAFTGSGTIIIGAGATLTLGADFNAPNLNLVLAGGSLNLNGATATFGTLNITGTSVLDFGSSTASILTVNDVTFQSSGLQLTLQNWVNLSDYFYAQNFTGAPTDTRGVTPVNQITANGYSNNDTAWQSLDNQITPAPEPSTYGALFMLGTAGLVVWRRRAAKRPQT